jgi:hypothetical protein
VLNSTQQAVGLYWVPEHAGMRGNEIADKLTGDGSVQRFVGPHLFLGVSRQNIRRKMKRWMEKQHPVLWYGPCSTWKQDWELISGPDLATRAQLLSFNRTQEVIRSRQAWQHESSNPKSSIHFTALQANKIRHKWCLNGKNILVTQEHVNA